ncbi:MAG: hypothetical protein PHR68_02495 [Candidatus Gracilibacteria bacterium]|nr:hypothetical protein [Candidatus Gracilibacteria bacterium]
MQNIGFEYQTKSTNEILDLLLNNSNFDYIVFIILIIGTFVLIMYFFPILDIFVIEKQKEIEKKRKKDKIKYLSIQNELQTQIEKDFEEEDKREVEAKLKQKEM